VKGLVAPTTRRLRRTGFVGATASKTTTMNQK
jgi:hypothetical protein